MKDKQFKKFSMKMRFFVTSLVIITLMTAIGYYLSRDSEIIKAGMNSIVFLCAIATTGKAADDFQRGMFFNKNLNDGGEN